MYFNVRYYLVAILFILFDLEVAFVFPWAVVQSQLGWFECWRHLIRQCTRYNHQIRLAWCWSKNDTKTVKVITRLLLTTRVCISMCVITWLQFCLFYLIWKLLSCFHGQWFNLNWAGLALLE
jgi:hypothetical protein